MLQVKAKIYVAIAMIKKVKYMSEYKYKIELHAHSNPVSTCSEISPDRVVEAYAELGFDGVVISNHFNANVLKGNSETEMADYYLRDFHEAVQAGIKNNIKVYLGAEIRFPEEFNEYLVFGIDEQDIHDMIKYIYGTYPEFYEGFKNNRNIILQAHPFRKKMIRQNPSLLDGMEVFNCHPHHNSNIAVASRYADQYPHFIKTAGTDFHHEGHQGLGYIKTKSLPHDSYDLAEILKQGQFVNCISGYELRH